MQPDESPRPEEQRARASLFARALRSREMGVFISTLVVTGIILSMGPQARSSFLDVGNLSNLARQIALLGVFAIGEALVIICGGIDLSVGSLIAFSGVVVSILLTTLGWPILPAMLVVLALGVVVGLIHGAFITKLRMPPFVITLGTLEILRGASLLMTEAMPIDITDKSHAAFNYLGNGMVFGFIPVPAIFLAVVALLAVFLMHSTVWGRYIYGVGGNEEAARLSGVNVARTKLFVYAAASFLAALAGLLYAAYIRQGSPSSGIAYELNAIAAAVIGGCSLMGGEGSVLGTVLGAALLGLLINGINLVVQTNASLWEGVIVGLVVVGAVAMNLLRERKTRAT
jgi:ribose transport system permease protein